MMERFCGEFKHHFYRIPSLFLLTSTSSAAFYFVLIFSQRYFTAFYLPFHESAASDLGELGEAQ